MGSALWPIPCVGVLLAVGLGIALPALDSALQESGDDPLTFVFGGGPAAARDLLTAISGSLISVTGLTFSLTVVALQLSSTQYSPRLLQTFATDRVVQLTLAQLVLTFVYALTVLRTVRAAGPTEDDSAFVPRLSITVAYLLTLASVLALVFFLGHLTRLLRVETMLRDVHDEALATAAREFPEGDDGDRAETSPAGTPLVLLARSSGFVVDVDEAAAVRAATEAGVVVQLAARIGDAVVVGTPLGHAWTTEPPVDVDTGQLEDALDRAVRLDFERSAERDVAYGLRKVVDIAVRALSPGTNDPTTAVHALSHVSALVGGLVTRPPTDRRVCGEDGELRLTVPAWAPEALAALAFEEPLQFAEGQPAVLRRIAAALREVAWRAPGGSLDELVRRYLGQLVSTARRSTALPGAELDLWHRQVEQALQGHWPPGDQ